MDGTAGHASSDDTCSSADFELDTTRQTSCNYRGTPRVPALDPQGGPLEKKKTSTVPLQMALAVEFPIAKCPTRCPPLETLPRCAKSREELCGTNGVLHLASQV